MQGISGSLRDCPIIIYDIEYNHIAHAIIVSHDRVYNIIEISKPLEFLEIGTRLNLLIIAHDGAAEFRGTLRNLLNTGHEIALFNKRSRKARAAPRHKLDSPAVITKIVTLTAKIPIEPPLRVTVGNISASGILIKSCYRQFETGTFLELHINIHGRNAILNVSVVREFKTEEGDIDYGCKLVFPDTEPPKS